MVSRAAGADEHEGYEDAQGNWRVPHKLMMVQVHAGWCRVCKGLQPRLLKLIAKHPEVLCCKINKTHNEASVYIRIARAAATSRKSYFPSTFCIGGFSHTLFTFDRGEKVPWSL